MSESYEVVRLGPPSGFVVPKRPVGLVISAEAPFRRVGGTARPLLEFTRATVPERPGLQIREAHRTGDLRVGSGRRSIPGGM